MPRNEEANQQIREAQRAKILDAAREVFARKGMAATMGDVATAAGVSQGLAYRYFANKDELINILVEESVQSGFNQTHFMGEMPESPWERLALLITRIVDARREHPEFFQLFFHMMYDDTVTDSLRALIEQRGRSFEAGMRELIVASQATGEIAAGDPDQLIITMMAFLDGLTRLAVTEPERFKEHAPDADIILRIFKPGTK